MPFPKHREEATEPTKIWKLIPRPSAVLNTSLPMAAVLSEHDLRTLKLQVHKSTFRPLIGDTETKEVAPKGRALFGGRTHPFQGPSEQNRQSVICLLTQP